MIAEPPVLEDRPYVTATSAARPLVADADPAALLTMQGVTASLQLLLAARRAARVGLERATNM